jgi:hypothetical protein
MLLEKDQLNYLNLAREILQRNGLTKISDEDRTMTFTAEESEFNEG